MSDKGKTKQELLDELAALRKRLEVAPDAGTERKRQDAERARERLLLRTLLDNIPDSVYFKDHESRFLLINRALAKRLGLRNPAEAVGKTDRNFFSAEHAQAAFADERHVIETGRPLIGKVEKETWADGTVLWVSSTKMPLYSDEGDVVGTFGVSRDVTESKRQEEELRRHREELEELVAQRTAALKRANRQLEQDIAERKKATETIRAERDRAQTYLNIAGTMILVIDDGGKLELINTKGCQILGYEESDIVGRDWFQTCLPRSLAANARQQFFASLSESRDEAEYEDKVLTRNGSERLIAWHTTQLHDLEGNATGILCSGEDITDRRRTEQALRESERLEAIGTLASGVAHNFTNLIRVIKGYASAIADRFIPNTAVHEEAMHIVDAADHAAALTKQLLQVARASNSVHETRIETVSLSQVLQDTHDIIEHSLAAKNITVNVVKPSSMPYVKADPGQLIDTLMNLLLNASDAMPNGGTVTIDAQVREVKRPSPRLNPKAAPGHYGVLRIRDTGVGMNRKTIRRIFDPFFTTKRTANVFGLGLTVAQSMVQGWGGWVAVRSREGQGSSFRVFVPLVDTPTERKKDASRQAAEGIILVVDDEPIALETVSSILKQSGYTVLSAADGKTAIELYEANADAILVSLVDLIMPGVNGSDVVEKIFQRDPQANIVMMSGFSRDYVRGQLPVGAWGFIQKPFEPQKLLETLNARVRNTHKSRKVSRN